MELSVPSIAPAAARGLVNNPKTTYRTCARGLPLQHQFARSRLRSLACLMMFNKQSSQRNNRRVCSLLQAVSPLQCTEIATQLSVSFEDFCISVSTEEDKVVKIQVNVAGTRTDSTFEEVFRKNVAAAQPFPGFRRLKGVYLHELVSFADTWNCLPLHMVLLEMLRENTRDTERSCSALNWPIKSEERNDQANC